MWLSCPKIKKSEFPPTIIHSLRITPHLFHPSDCLGRVRNCVDFMIESGKWGDVQLEVVELEWPLSSKEAEAQIIAAVLQDESTTPASLLLIDHISSNPAMVFDVAAIASAAKQGNFFFFVIPKN